MISFSQALNEEVNQQKTNARDAINAGKKLLRDTSTEDDGAIRDKMETLKNNSDNLTAETAERLSNLEQALPIAKSFDDTHQDLVVWLAEVEPALAELEIMSVDANQVKKQQESVKVRYWHF